MRSSTSPRTAAGVAARADRVGRLQAAPGRRGAQGTAQAPGRGGRTGALHAQGLPGPAPVLDRGPGHDRADARRADPARRLPGWTRGRGGDGPQRTAERARAQPGTALRHDLRRVRGRLDARGGHDDPPRGNGRREVSPRHAGLLQAARRRHNQSQLGVQSKPPGVRVGGRGGRNACGADLAHRTDAPTKTPIRRCRS